MASSSQELIERLFLKPEEYEESPLRDRKQDFPTKSTDEKKKAEFVRDFIALANSAAVRGEPAYLLWGINDDPPEVIGIERFFGDHVRDRTEIGSKAQDDAGNWIFNWIMEYVEPAHSGLKVIYGTVNEHLVACLEIHCAVTPDGRPFRIKKDFGRGKKYLTIGQAWIRAGANKFELGQVVINETSPGYRFNWRVVPYLRPSTLQSYLERLLQTKFIAEWEKVRSYQESRLEDGRTLTQAVDQLLHGPGERMLVLEGPAGSGKSTVVQRHVSALCETRLEELRGIISRQEYSLPTGHIPVIVVLRNAKDSLDRAGIAKTIASEIRIRTTSDEANWKPEVEEPEQILHDKALNWLVFLDGADELGEYTRKFVDELKGFLTEYNRVRVILTMRTGAVYEDWSSLEGATSARMELLSDEQVRNYLRSADTEEASIENALSFLDDTPDFAELCRTPAFLAQAMQELLPVTTFESADNPFISEPILPITAAAPDDDESDVPTLSVEPYTGSERISVDNSEVQKPDDIVIPIRKGVLLKRIYDYLWQRELVKSGVDRRANDWKVNVGDLALLTDGARPKFDEEAIRKSRVTKRAREWLLMVGVLVKPAENQYSFHANLTKLHFGAHRTSVLLETSEFEAVKTKLSRCQPSFRTDLLQLLADVTDADLSQLS